MPRTILITGFGRFPGAPFNPSEWLVTRLAKRNRPAFASVRRIAHVFRTSYAPVENELAPLLKEHQPDIVLMFGVATRTNHVRIETRALNQQSMLFPDADRYRPNRPWIEKHGPISLRSAAPTQATLSAARAAGVRARLSHNAGRYLCNFAYWRGMALASQHNGPGIVLFVHVPLIARKPRKPLSANRRLMTSNELMRAGEAIMMVLLATKSTRV